MPWLARDAQSRRLSVSPLGKRLLRAEPGLLSKHSCESVLRREHFLKHPCILFRAKLGRGHRRVPRVREVHRQGWKVAETASLLTMSQLLLEDIRLSGWRSMRRRELGERALRLTTSAVARDLLAKDHCTGL